MRALALLSHVGGQSALPAAVPPPAAAEQSGGAAAAPQGALGWLGWASAGTEPERMTHAQRLG